MERILKLDHEIKKIIPNRHEVSTVAGKSDTVDNNNDRIFNIFPCHPHITLP